MDQHVSAAGGGLGVVDCLLKVADVVDEGVIGELGRGGVPAQNEDRDPGMVVAAPAASGLDRAPTGEHRPGRHQLRPHLTVRPRQMPADCSGVVHPTLAEPHIGTRFRVHGYALAEHPLVQPLAAVAETVVGPHVGPSDEAIDRDRHIEHGRRHQRPPSPDDPSVRNTGGQHPIEHLAAQPSPGCRWPTLRHGNVPLGWRGRPRGCHPSLASGSLKAVQVVESAGDRRSTPATPGWRD